jgi:serine protease
VMTVQGAAIGPFKMVIKAGDPVAGTFATHDRGQVRLSVTNFGGLGYYTGIHFSRFELEGQGFRFPATSQNWLFHASFMAGTGPQRLSDDIPYSEDTQNASDWIPLFGAPILVDEAFGGQRITAAYDDRRALAPLDLRVRQESFAWSDAEASDFVVVQYVVTNVGTQTLSGLRFGLFADWDLPGTNGDPAERGAWEPSARLGFVQASSNQPAFGVVWLDDVSLALLTYAVLSRDSIAESTKGSPAAGLTPAEAPTGFEAFTDPEKWDALSSGQTRTADTRARDLWQVIGVGPVALAAGATDTVAVALVAGATRDQLRLNAVAARDVYFRRVIGREPPPPPPPPGELVLEQNFPNPFRHGESTTIRFDVPPDASGTSASVELAVFDVAGRRVRTLVQGTVVAGELGSSWDGLDDTGTPAPAGIYVLRLVASGTEQAVRMLLLP